MNSPMPSSEVERVLQECVQIISGHIIDTIRQNKLGPDWASRCADQLLAPEESSSDFSLRARMEAIGGQDLVAVFANRVSPILVEKRVSENSLLHHIIHNSAIIRLKLSMSAAPLEMEGYVSNSRSEYLETGESALPKSERPTRERESCIVICSDVHLGTAASQDKNFYDRLTRVSEGDTVVLLGDILDFWIFDGDDLAGDLVDRIIGEWERLWDSLNQLSNKKGVTIRYVPGNHDAFVFLVEAYQHPELEWCRAILQRSEVFQEISRATLAKRMTHVASIHYPCFEMSLGNGRTLFTHGHYDNWFWRAIAGIPEDAMRDRPHLSTLLTTASIVYAHKHARGLRAIAARWEGLERIHHIEDVAISITNAVVRAYLAAEYQLRGAFTTAEDLCRLIDHALAIYCDDLAQVTSVPLTKVEQRKIRDSLKTLGKLHGRQADTDMMTIYSNTNAYLNSRGAPPNISLNRRVSSHPDGITTDQLSNYCDPDQLVFGHYHNPRMNSPAFDAGGFVLPLEGTYLVANGSGALEFGE